MKAKKMQECLLRKYQNYIHPKGNARIRGSSVLANNNKSNLAEKPISTENHLFRFSKQYHPMDFALGTAEEARVGWRGNK